VSGLGSDNRQLPVMQINPLYWDKNLPRSAIQYVSFYCPADRDRLSAQRDERLRNNDGSYHVSRFVEAIDIEPFSGLIGR
jgi:hypothetical protein